MWCLSEIGVFKCGEVNISEKYAPETQQPENTKTEIEKERGREREIQSTVNAHFDKWKPLTNMQTLSQTQKDTSHNLQMKANARQVKHTNPV